MTKSQTMHEQALSRRAFLKGSGALVVSFSLAACGVLEDDDSEADPTPTESQQEVTGDEVPGSTVTPVPQADEEERSADSEEYVDSWLAVDEDGEVTVFCGKVELGTGVTSALTQIVAEELDVEFERIEMIMGDTAQTEDQGYTAGSKTIQVAGPVLRSASAEARAALLELAAEQLQASDDELSVENGTISAQNDSSDSVTYGELLTGQQFNRRIPDEVTTKDPADYSIVGESIPRVDIPGKLTGEPSYVQDLRVSDMLHGRVVRPWVLRPDGVNASVQDINEDSVSDIPGVVQVVRDGNFVGVVAEREEQAIRAAEQLEVTWEEDESLPPHGELYEQLRDFESEEEEPVNEGDVESAFEENEADLEVTYQFPFQAHASMGPSCAVADISSEEQATVWTSSQGVYPLRGALAELLDMPEESIHVIHMEGAGCYGHNGFDDVSADAAMLSRAVGQPVRVQWMREDEFAWEPKGPAMVMDVRGSVSDEGEVVAWEFEGWTPTHTTRPGSQAGNLIAGKLVENRAPEPDNPAIGGDRNAPTTYDFPDVRVATHYLDTTVLRSSALRTLGAMANAFANESFMDEMAAEAGIDPVEFRLSHLSDERAIEVIQSAAEEYGWESRPSPAESSDNGTASGRGIAYAQYENENAYVATVAEVEVDRESGEIRVQRVVAAHDCGLIINPDGLTNQIEGNVIQATSRTLKEEVVWDDSLITTLDWASYPILTFAEVPEVQSVLIDRPDEPAVGAGEPASVPIAPAIGNAVFDATGARLRSIPFTPERVQEALG